MSETLDLFDWQPPTYPATPGFVRGSDTSEAAASSLDPNVLTELRLRVYQFALKQEPRGVICDEVETALGMAHQTASARIRELELSGWLVKTEDKRLTRSGRSARIYRPHTLGQSPARTGDELARI
jgi:hypothetical protein